MGDYGLWVRRGWRSQQATCSYYDERIYLQLTKVMMKADDQLVAGNGSV